MSTELQKPKSIKTQENEIRSFLETLVFQTVSNDRDEFKQLLQIMEAQPQWECKLDNIIGFRVTRRKKYKSLLLQVKVMQCNGRQSRWLTVSWKKGTITKRKEGNPLHSAFRNAISRQCSTWAKTNWNNKSCMKCNGTTLLQVDHVDPQFAKIRKDFVASFPDEYKFPTDFKPSKRGARFLPADVKFTRKWQQYHRQNANYQWLCRSCNCKKPKE